MSSGSLKENMDRKGESTKARVMLGRRVRKTRLMDEMDWRTKGVVARRRLDIYHISGYTNTPRNLDRRLFDVTGQGL